MPLLVYRREGGFWLKVISNSSPAEVNIGLTVRGRKAINIVGEVADNKTPDSAAYQSVLDDLSDIITWGKMGGDKPGMISRIQKVIAKYDVEGD